ncbi:mechanosensitive ion channel family protein [Litchfieldella xinjiangensis]|uniref:mechanosensitive ion channel family protein n=1 Tax=Litchfieldella xinjiangensis TaxID=1166948 RepID=UPI000693D598|nr:mechanosensitive ion channel family protein [Halomonas xinjiangensis]
MKLKDAWPLWIGLVLALAFSSLGMAQTNEGKQAQDEERTLWFSIDSVNTGLDEAPDEVERLTPRDAIRSFVELSEEENYAAAAHVLNLSKFPPEEQPSRGIELARQLASILRRGEWLNISSLSGRQDAAIEDPSGQHPRAGEPRRNLQLASLDVGGETYDIRLARYRVDEEDPIWLVSPESLAAIPKLYEEYGPSLLEQYIPEQLRTSLGMLALWEWLAIPLFLLILALVGWAVYRLVGVTAHWLPSGSPSIFAGRIKGPMALIVMSLVAQVLLNYVVSFTAVATTFLRILLIAIMAWGLGTIALRLVDTIMLRMMRRLVGEIDDTKPKDERKLLTSLYALRRAIILIMVVAVTVYALSQISLFETLGMTLMASASVLAVLVGIAGQAVLGNILSSFQLSLAKPIRIGDLVVFEGKWCHVEGIFYTYIRLRTWDEQRVIVPVTYFVSKPFENLSVKSAKMYRSLAMKVHVSADIQCLREKFMEYAEEEDNVVEHHKLCCYVTGQTDMALEFTCYLMTSEPYAGWVAEMNVREKMMTFIRNHHPEWWPREVAIVGQEDIALGTQPSADASHPPIPGNTPDPGSS